MGVFDIDIEKPAEVSQVDGCVWYSHGTAGVSMTISNTSIASTDLSRFFHDYIKHTHRFDGLQQVFPWLYQTHPSAWLTSAGFSMTISNTPIVLTDFRRFFHDYVKHTPLRRCQQVFPWQCQAHTSSTDFRRFSHDYQTHPSPRLTSAGFPMTMSRTHLFNWLQQVFPWLCQAHTWKNLLKSVEEVCAWHSHGKTCWSQLKRCVLNIVMEKPAVVSWRGVYLT
jgi:hypothetical protein